MRQTKPLACPIGAPYFQRFFDAIKAYDAAMEPVARAAVNALNGQTIDQLTSLLPGLRLNPSMMKQLAMDGDKVRFYERNLFEYKRQDYWLGFYAIEAANSQGIDVLPYNLLTQTGQVIVETPI